MVQTPMNFDELVQAVIEEQATNPDLKIGKAAQNVLIAEFVCGKEGMQRAANLVTEIACTQRTGEHYLISLQTDYYHDWVLDSLCEIIYSALLCRLKDMEEPGSSIASYAHRPVR